MCKISSSGSPDPGQCTSQDRSDQAPQRIVQNIVNLKVTQVIVQLGKFRRAAAEKSYDRTGDNTVAHRLTYKRKQISHRNVQQNVQEDFTGRRVVSDVDVAERLPDAFGEHLQSPFQSQIKVKGLPVIAESRKLGCVDAFPAQDRETEIAQNIHGKNDERRSSDKGFKMQYT